MSEKNTVKVLPRFNPTIVYSPIRYFVQHILPLTSMRVSTFLYAEELLHYFSIAASSALHHSSASLYTSLALIPS